MKSAKKCNYNEEDATVLPLARTKRLFTSFSYITLTAAEAPRLQSPYIALKPLNKPKFSFLFLFSQININLKPVFLKRMLNKSRRKREQHPRQPKFSSKNLYEDSLVLSNNEEISSFLSNS